MKVIDKLRKAEGTGLGKPILEKFKGWEFGGPPGSRSLLKNLR
jgi:hypothetical protein